MPGGTESHSKISLNIGGDLMVKLKGRECSAYNGDMRIRTSSAGLYTYADAVVASDPKVERNTLLNPIVIAEVLSKRTRNYDRGDKFEMYRQIPSFLEYLLVAQDRVYVEHHARQSGSESRPGWLMREYHDLDDTVYLPSIDIRLRLSDVYDKVSFPIRLPSLRKK